VLGTNFNRTFSFDNINCINSIKFNTNINDTSALKLSYLNNTTSDIQNQINTVNTTLTNAALINQGNNFSQANTFSN
jgi:hypothetical protein